MTDLQVPPSHPTHDNWLIPTGGKTASRVWHPDEPILESVKNELIQICCGGTVEFCGVIDSAWDVHEISNIHQHPERNFYMDFEVARQTFTRIHSLHDRTIKAIWHTHPNNVVWPSPRDIAGWPNPALGWRYLIVTQKDVYEWELDG